MARRFHDLDGDERPCFDADPAPAAGDHIFVHETGRNHFVWQVTRSGRPVVLIDGGFRPLPADEYVPLAGGG